MATPRPALRAAAASAGDLALEHPVTTELVGSKAAANLQADRPLTSALTRQVIALALSVDESALDGFDDDDLEHAIGRLRRLAQTIERLSAEAATDELTGIQRRGPGMLALQREIDREQRRRTRGVIVAFVDVDGLKRVNDTRGHAAGDRLLQEVAAGIRSRIRSYDLFFRYGGDEFVIALLDVDAGQAKSIIADIGAEILKRTRGATISVGAEPIRAEDTADLAVARADAALYRGRRRSRGPAGRSVERARLRAS